jgi:hypothetical protein
MPIARAAHDPVPELDATHLSAITADSHLSTITEDSTNEPHLPLTSENPPRGAHATPHLALDRDGIPPPQFVLTALPRLQRVICHV